MSEQAKRRVGAPEFEPTKDNRNTVKAMAAYGIPHVSIGRVIGCSAPTLRKYFAEELDTGETEATSQVAQTLFNIATKGATQRDMLIACMFWLKCRAGWRDRDGQIEAPGKKELRREAAASAGIGTEWGDLLSPPASSLN